MIYRTHRSESARALHTLLMAWLPKLKVGGAAYLVAEESRFRFADPRLDDALGRFTASKYASSRASVSLKFVMKYEYPAELPYLLRVMR